LPPWYSRRWRSDKTAVVLPFEDDREDINSNDFLLYAIPLVPFGWQDLNVPEGAQMHLTSGLWINYKPTEDFAKALAEELENARLFNETHFDFGRGTADVVIHGKILNTYYQSKILSYGLSVYGPMLWLLGLPAGTFTNQLSVELSCSDPRNSQVIFSKKYDIPPEGKVVWIYTLPSDFNYAEMLKQVNQQFVGDLRTQAAAISPQ
jgi:hypothetical protein